MGLYMAQLPPPQNIIAQTPPFSNEPHTTPPSNPGMTTRSQHGIFKPNPKYSQALFVTTVSPIPKNPIHALRDQN